MQRAEFLSLAAKALATLTLCTALLPHAQAADRVRVGVFPSSAALPFSICQSINARKADSSNAPSRKGVARAGIEPENIG